MRKTLDQRRWLRSHLRAANAQQIDVKIGVLSDMSSLTLISAVRVRCCRQNGTGFSQDHPKRGAEDDQRDHQNKPDIGTQIANHRYDVDKVDMIIDAELRCCVGVSRGRGGEEQDHRLRSAAARR